MFKRLAILSLLSSVACNSSPAETTPTTAGVTLADKYRCLGDATSGTSSFSLEHTVFVMSDGSASTTCAVDLPGYQITAFNMFKPGTAGARTGLCAVGADLDGTADYGYWEMALNDDKTASVATFHNTGSAENGKTFTLSCSKY